MTTRNLETDPAWQAEDLGHPLPDSEHAVSVALPTWRDVVGYEEKWPEVVNRLTCGYPRFVIHRLVRQLADRIAGEGNSLPFPSRKAAEACVAFIERQSGVKAQLVERDGYHAVLTPDAGADSLKAFWQHTGLIVSTRRARSVLEGSGTPHLDEAGIRDSLRRKLADLYDCEPDDVFLQPSGMAALYAALNTVRQRTPGAATVQLGFPYVDTYKLQEKFGSGATLLHDLSRCAADLEELIARAPLAGCFTEIPGNPLLGAADLREVTPILRRHGIPLVADDVVATPVNIDLRPHADLIATSLTKFLAGTGDAMGGALICNPRSPYHAELKAIAGALHEELLWVEDAQVLDAQAGGFPQRMLLHNANGLEIARRLKAHPAVEQVWYPKWSFGEAYEAVRRPDGGWGALITFLPRDAERTAPGIYDGLQLCKGPSLGTVFTLACPFTLLAHYSELEWAEACGVPRNLIRISVGLEDVEEIWRRIVIALER